MSLKRYSRTSFTCIYCMYSKQVESFAQAKNSCFRIGCFPVPRFRQSAHQPPFSPYNMSPKRVALTATKKAALYSYLLTRRSTSSANGFDRGSFSDAAKIFACDRSWISKFWRDCDSHIKAHNMTMQDFQIFGNGQQSTDRTIREYVHNATTAVTVVQRKLVDCCWFGF